MESYLNLNTSFTIEEIMSLNQLKEYLAKENINYRFDIYNNDFLIRFLRSCNCNIKKTYIKLMNYFQFAEENDIINIERVSFPNNDKLKLFYPHGFHKITKSGMPIFIQSLGDIKIDDINRLLPNNKLNKYIILLLERLRKNILPKTSQALGKTVTQVFCLVDLKGLTTSLMSKKIFDFVSAQLTICENYYPGIFGNLYFVNTGLVFRAVWGACKYFFSKETRNKIGLLGFDYHSKLLELINGLNLPKFLGGECNCEPYGCIFSEVGPWTLEPIKRNNTISFIPNNNKEGAFEQLSLNTNKTMHK